MTGKVLVIDDNADLRGTIRQMLIAAHYDVLEARDGQEGIEIFARESPGIVVTDLLMPRKEGIDTIRELRAFGKAVFIVAMSGDGEHHMDFLSIAKRMGADAIIAKPFRARELIEILHSSVIKPKQN